MMVVWPRRNVEENSLPDCYTAPRKGDSKLSFRKDAVVPKTAMEINR